MILIGFTWVILSTVLSLIVKMVLPGRWEDHGPNAMLVTAAGAFMGGILGGILYDGINGYGPPSNSEATVGVVLSILGGLVAFAGYAVDVRRRAHA
jgi:hypothetical protein